MISEIISQNLSQYGLAGIFIICLLITGKTLYEDCKRREDYIIEKNEERETKYQKVIEENQQIIFNLTKNLEVLEEMKKDVKELKSLIKK